MSIRRYVKDVKESISLVLQVINYWLNFLTRIANVKHQNRSITASFLYYLSHFLLNNALAISLWMLLSLWNAISLWKLSLYECFYLYEMLSLYECFYLFYIFFSYKPFSIPLSCSVLTTFGLKFRMPNYNINHFFRISLF